MPSLDPKAHRTQLLQQLDAIANQVKARAETARDELATREIVAVRPRPMCSSRQISSMTRGRTRGWSA